MGMANIWMNAPLSLVEGVMHGGDGGRDALQVLRAVARQLGQEGVGRGARVGRVAPGLHHRRLVQPAQRRRRRRRHHLRGGEEVGVEEGLDEGRPDLDLMNERMVNARARA